MWHSVYSAERVLNIFTVSVDGSGPAKRLTTGPRQKYHPVWSPDGRQIAYVGRGRRRAADVIVIADVEGRAKKALRAPIQHVAGLDWQARP